MKVGERSWCVSTTSRVTTAAFVVVLSVILLPSRADALSISRREPVTEQVLVITTPSSATETPSLLQDEEELSAGGASTPPSSVALMLESEQSDMPAGDQDASTTVDTIIVQDTTGESYEVNPTASNIISKDVEIEIATSNSRLSAVDAGQEEDNSKPILPEIYSFRVESNIKYRYSRTYITSRVANKDLKRAQEVTFSVVLPETAFISKFIMEIDGKPYEAYVKEKEEAKKDYAQAQSQGQSAGLVEKSTRNSNVFNVNVNIKPQTKVTFNLTYEELLTRRLGRYEQAININPDQVSSIKDYQILVNIEESRNLTLVRVPSLSNDIDGQNPEGNNPDAVIERPAPNKAKITWTPSSTDQKKLVKEGISGKFVVQYDVDREAEAGQILVMQGYFVHFFAPENLPPLRKHVVFILDISGSMWGRKMEQLKESQTKILDDLSADDYFNIITFSSDVYLWSPNDVLNKKNSDFRQPSFPAMTEITPPELLARRQPLPATPENVNKAKAFIDSLVASGGTNIHDAIIEALNLTATIKDQQKKAQGGSSTEPAAIETTILPVSSTPAGTTSTSTESSPSSSSSSTAAATTTTTTSTEAAPSSTTAGGTDDNDENRTVDIIDVAKSDLGEFMTEVPDVTSTAAAVPENSDGKVILPPNVQSLIIFLTDGEPTVGITDPPEIQKLIRTANQNLSIPIFSLGFGEGADFPFLKKLSLQNNGFGRKIYEASDAALQLKGFYNEIASPLLSNVKFNYTSEEYNVTDLTVTRFPTVFGGTEIAVAGKLVAPPKPERFDEGETTTLAASEDAPQPSTLATVADETPGLDSSSDDFPSEPNRLSIACDFEQSDRYFFDVNVEGIGRDGEVDLSKVEVYERPPKCGLGIDFPFILLPPSGSQFPPRPTPPPTPEDTFLERLWAYLTIQQLIEKDLAGLEDPSAGDAKPSDNSVDDTTTINPTSTFSPDDSSQVTRVLPNQGSTTATPSVTRNATRPETPKQRALRLALRYGFVTPLTSLVVVKPNSSDVTNAVPTDGRPDALDSLFARKFSFQAPILPSPSHSYQRSGSSSRHSKTSSGSIPFYHVSRYGGGGGSTPTYIPRSRGYSSASGPWPYRAGIRKKAGATAPQSIALALAAPAYQSGIRNKIAYSPLPISSNYNYNSRPIPPVPLAAANPYPPSGALGFGGGAGGPPGFGAPGFQQQLLVDYEEDESTAEMKPAPSPVNTNYVVPTAISTPRTPPPPPSTSSSPALTLSDITWLSGNQQTIRLNETDYMIARSQTNGDNEGYECSGMRGSCRHLQSCVLSDFASNETVFRSSYFCEIKSSSNSYAGVCCPSNANNIRRQRSFDLDP